MFNWLFRKRQGKQYDLNSTFSGRLDVTIEGLGQVIEDPPYEARLEDYIIWSVFAK